MNHTRTAILEALAEERYIADVDGEERHICAVTKTHALVKTPHGHGWPRMVPFRQLTNIRKEEA